MAADDRTGDERALEPLDLVRLAALVLLLCHVALRTWQLTRGWFYSDDFIFLDDALDKPFGLDLLLTPHDSQLMPVGVAISWVVAHAGTYAWGTAAVITLVLEALAAIACYLALRTLFGERPAILLPFAFYLFSAMSPESLHWWAAALNAVPMQIAFFVLVLAITRWTRERRPADGVLTVAALALAAASGPRGLVMVVPVALVVLLFLTPGRLRARPWAVARRDWPILAPLAAVAVGYLVLYRATTPSPVEAAGSAPGAAITGNLLGRSWLPSLVGGPWRWDENNPPMSQPDPPVVLLVLAAVVVAGLISWSVRRNPRATGAALVVVAAQLLVTTLALVFGRGLQLGASAGLMTRYLTDTLPVTALAIGLATLPVLGTTAVTEPRPWALGLRARQGLVGVGVLALLGSLVSTVSYARNWHADYPAKEFVQTAGRELRDDPGPIADVEVPDAVQSRLSFPNNLPSHLLRPYGRLVDARDRGNDLRVLGDDGQVRQAAVLSSTTSKRGPERGCGYRVGDQDRATIEVERDEVNSFWWARIGYLASQDGEIELRVDDRAPVRMEVFNGLHTYFLQGEDAFSRVRLRSLTPGMAVCVDTVSVGDLVDVG